MGGYSPLCVSDASVLNLDLTLSDHGAQDDLDREGHSEMRNVDWTSLPCRESFGIPNTSSKARLVLMPLVVCNRARHVCSVNISGGPSGKRHKGGFLHSCARAKPQSDISHPLSFHWTRARLPFIFPNGIEC